MVKVTMELQQLPQQQLISHSSTTIEHNSAGNKPFSGKDGFTFADVLDMVNPLQHLPVVSKYYREQTGDDCCEGAKLVGGAVFGALLGGISGVFTAMANSAVRHETEQDVSEHLIELVDDFLDPDDGSLLVDGSLNFITPNPQESDIQTKMRPERRALNAAINQTEEMNPFFAQIFNEGGDESYPVQSISQTYQGKDWGSV